MTDLEQLVHRRFRLALLGYIILAVAAIAGLAVSYAQERQINHNEQRIGALAVCDAPHKVRDELHVSGTRCEALIKTYRQYAKPTRQGDTP